MNKFVGLVIATALLTVPLSANALTFKSGEKKSFKTETGTQKPTDGNASKSKQEIDGLVGTIKSPDHARKTYSSTESNEQARSGKTSQRIEVRHGDCYDWDCQNDRRRVEFQQRNQDTNQYIGRTVWYGWSIFLPNDFADLTPTQTLIGQVQMHGWGTPLWNFNIRDGQMIIEANATDGKDFICNVASLQEIRGRWTDIVVKANYSLKNEGGYVFEAWANDKIVCSREKPLITQQMINEAKSSSLRFKYGIYNGYVSRWLKKNATRSVESLPFVHKRKTGDVSRSYSNTPFEFDWGVKLPTQVVYYDEMRIDFKREVVDVRILESQSTEKTNDISTDAAVSSGSDSAMPTQSSQ